MGWKELVSKLRLVDINAKLETEQLGVVNVKNENKIFNFHFHNAEAVKAFIQIEKTPELENAIHEDAVRRLENISHSPESLSSDTMTEIASASTASAAMDIAIEKYHLEGDIEE